MRAASGSRNRTGAMNSFRSSTRALGSILAIAWMCLGPGCAEQGSTVLGQSPPGEPLSLSDARSIPNNKELVLMGTLVEKCPEAGCWFVLKDPGGTVKVDTKTAGFVAVDIPLNRRLTVVGRWINQGRERVLAATGLRY